MNLLVVGVSHHTVPVEVLETVTVGADATAGVLAELIAQPHVGEVVVLSTCNRVEVYAAVTAFHSGLAEIGGVLAGRAGVDVAEFAAHLYVHFDGEAARHALRVASGLDSMVVGEAQILGQLREAYAVAAERDTVGRLLHDLMQQALRVGKRVHAETAIDRAGQSVVSAALGLAPPAGGSPRRALVIGAGSMGGLALATLRRAGADALYVANRSVSRAQRLAELHGAEVVDLGDLDTALSTMDLVVCATASPDPVLTRELVLTAMASRPADRGPLTLLDLAVPRDVTPEVGQLPGVSLIDMTQVASADLAQPSAAEQLAAERIVEAEVTSVLSWLRGTEVGPTVAALRARADEVVSSELARLRQRRPDFTEQQRADVAHAVHRVVQRLLHSPTVRVRQLASTDGGDQYAAALRELFDLSVPSTDDDLTRAVAVASYPAAETPVDEGEQA